jgi:tRNA(adenine34) deaminase
MEKEKSLEQTFMAEALLEAEKAYRIGEVPIGAVVVKDGVIIGRGHNLRETGKDPTAHAEIIAIREAAETLGGWRLTGCEIYVTIEPCVMCAGAIYQARLDRVVIGALDPKAGACRSLYEVCEDQRLNHQVAVTIGVMERESAALMKSFFKALRS